MDPQILSYISIIATFVGGFYLKKQNDSLIKLSDTQTKLIETQTKQLDNLKTYSDLLSKFTNPEDIDKIAANKIKLVEQEYEFKLQEKIKDFSENFAQEVGKKIEIKHIDQFGTGIDEMINFSMDLIRQMDIKDTIRRNLIIKDRLPTFADIIIKYLDTPYQSNSDGQSNL
jgi:hypothetical protein